MSGAPAQGAGVTGAAVAGAAETGAAVSSDQPKSESGTSGPRIRDDASTIIGMQSPLATIAALTFIVTMVIASAYGGGGVTRWPVFAVAIAVIAVAFAALLYAPGDPMVWWATLITGAAPALAQVLVGFSTQSAPALAAGTISGGCAAAMALLCVRGRVLAAWLGFVGSVIASVGYAALAKYDLVPWLMAQLPNIAVLLMAALFGALVRPAAREIYALRAQTAREVMAAASVNAALAERDSQLARLDDRARGLLEIIGSERPLSAAERVRCHLVEASLRDGIRARALDSAEVADAVWAARERGVTVTLLDDTGPTGDDEEREQALRRLRGYLVELLTAIADPAVGTTDVVMSDVVMTVRVLPARRDSLATVLMRSATHIRRVDFGLTGDVAADVTDKLSHLVPADRARAEK